MNFRKHYALEGQHAFLSASKYHWLNYSDTKLADAFYKEMAKEKGTRLHNLAHECIELGVKLPNKPRTTLGLFVNDAIGFRMKSEQPLYYSENCFGTADAISFNKNVLRIHDLKTGEIPAHFEQLQIYAALFCLEYQVKPMEIEKIELRIYQNNNIEIFEAGVDDIVPVMDKIVQADKIISKIREEEDS